MSRDPVARAYGRALHEAAAQAGVLPRVLAELDALDQALATELPDLLALSEVPLKVRLAVVDEIFAGADEHLLALVRLAIRKGRAAHLGRIAEEVREIEDVAAGRAKGRLTTAAPLSAALKAELEQALSKRLALSVSFEAAQDPGLLGGFRARVGDRLLDASLKTRLERLRRELRAG